MNFKSRIVMGCLLGVCVLQVSAEKTYKYRISLRLTLSAVRKHIFQNVPWNAGSGRA